MRALWLIPAACVAMAVPAAVMAAGGDGGFDSVLRSIESRYHVRATRIPMMGLMSFVAGRATHGGVANVHIAEIEDFTERVDGDELNAIVEQKLGEGWERMIRETSRHGGEQTLIFVRPEGQRIGMFIVDDEGSELDLVQVSVNPDHLEENLAKYDHHHERTDDSDDNDD